MNFSVRMRHETCENIFTLYIDRCRTVSYLTYDPHVEWCPLLGKHKSLTMKFSDYKSLTVKFAPRWLLFKVIFNIRKTIAHIRILITCFHYDQAWFSQWVWQFISNANRTFRPTSSTVFSQRNVIKPLSNFMKEHTVKF